MANRTRPIRLKFRVTEAEKKKIQKRMAQAKIDNQEAYIRKMAIDGYIVNLEIPGLKELVSDTRGYSKRFNEIIYPVCTLCRDHEKAGFEEGIKVGFRLAQEINA